jgi:hypothetical protein
MAVRSNPVSASGSPKPIIATWNRNALNHNLKHMLRLRGAKVPFYPSIRREGQREMKGLRDALPLLR